jgi:MFS family permease
MNIKTQHKNIILFSIGKFISIFGTSILTFAAGLFVLKQTGSGLSFAATLISGLLPIIIFGPISGILADRLNKKRIVLITDFLNGLLFLVLFFLKLPFEAHIYYIYIIAFLTTSLTTLFDISMMSAIPRLVSDEKLIMLNATNRIITSASTILGPIIGGLVYVFLSLEAFFLINGISFMISFAIEIWIDFNFNLKEKEKDKPAQEKLKIGHEFVDGIKYISKKQDLRLIIIVVVLINFFLGFSGTVPLPFVINTTLGLSAKAFGIIEAAFPVGLILGAFFVKRVIKLAKTETLVIWDSMLLAVVMMLSGIPMFVKVQFSEGIYMVFFSVLSGVMGVLIAWLDIPVINYLQTLVEEKYRGKLLGLTVSLGKIVLPIAYILTGFLLNAINPGWVMVGGSAILLASSVIILNKDKEQVD